jgi:hypothetical protein
MPASSTYYWVGEDGNVYGRSNDFNGVRNLGKSGPNGAIIHPNGVTTYAPMSQNPNPSTGGSSGGTGGGGGGGGSAAADPYAKWGGKAGYDRAVADYHTQAGSVDSSINDRIGNEGSKYNSGILDFLDSTGASQRKIDGQTVQNELAKRQGGAGVLDKIGHGLKSGGVLLANKNATNSSAGEALARAWSDIGRRDQTGVNNQYEQGKSGIADSENELQLQIQQGVRHMGENKTQIINSIVSDAQNAIAALNQAAANASLPDRVDIEAKKQEVRNKALGSLQAYDATLNQGVANIKPIDNLAAKTKAAGWILLERPRKTHSTSLPKFSNSSKTLAHSLLNCLYLPTHRAKSLTQHKRERKSHGLKPKENQRRLERPGLLGQTGEPATAPEYARRVTLTAIAVLTKRPAPRPAFSRAAHSRDQQSRHLSP